MKIKTILFFPNGNMAVFDYKGQVPTMQQPWVTLAIESIVAKGAEIDDETVIIMPDTKKIRLFKTSEGNLNWEFIK